MRLREPCVSSPTSPPWPLAPAGLNARRYVPARPAHGLRLRGPPSALQQDVAAADSGFASSLKNIQTKDKIIASACTAFVISNMDKVNVSIAIIPMAQVGRPQLVIPVMACAQHTACASGQVSGLGDCPDRRTGIARSQGACQHANKLPGSWVPSHMTRPCHDTRGISR